MLKCNECKRELDYCCELTILENWKQQPKDRPHLAHQDVYFAHQTKYGFDIAGQQQQLFNQNWRCGLCGRSRLLMIDKRQAIDEERLVFVCHSCQSVIARVKKYLDNE